MAHIMSKIFYISIITVQNFLHVSRFMADDHLQISDQFQLQWHFCERLTSFFLFYFQIDMRRANNCEIMLTKIKMPLPDMMVRFISSLIIPDTFILDEQL